MEIKELELKAAEALEKAEKALKERTYYTRANDIACLLYTSPSPRDA